MFLALKFYISGSISQQEKLYEIQFVNLLVCLVVHCFDRISVLLYHEVVII